MGSFHDAPDAFLPLSDAAHAGDQLRPGGGIDDPLAPCRRFVAQPGAKEPCFSDVLGAGQDHARAPLAARALPEERREDAELRLSKRRRARRPMTVQRRADRFQNSDRGLSSLVLRDALAKRGARRPREIVSAAHRELEELESVGFSRQELQVIERRQLLGHRKPFDLRCNGFVEVLPGRGEEHMIEREHQDPGIAPGGRHHDAGDGDGRIDGDPLRQIGARNADVRLVQARALGEHEAHGHLRLRAGDVLREEHLRLEQGFVAVAIAA